MKKERNKHSDNNIICCKYPLLLLVFNTSLYYIS